MFLENVVEVEEENFHDNFDAELNNEPESNGMCPDNFNKATLVSSLNMC